MVETILISTLPWSRLSFPLWLTIVKYEPKNLLSALWSCMHTVAQVSIPLCFSGIVGYIHERVCADRCMELDAFLDLCQMKIAHIAMKTCVLLFKVECGPSDIPDASSCMYLHKRPWMHLSLPCYFTNAAQHIFSYKFFCMLYNTARLVATEIANVR